MKKKKDVYQSPQVLRSLCCEMEEPLLASSPVEASFNDAGVKTAGQEVEEMDLSGSGFNHVWE